MALTAQERDPGRHPNRNIGDYPPMKIDRDSGSNVITLCDSAAISLDETLARIETLAETPTLRSIYQAFDYAGDMPDMVAVHGASGSGKSWAVQQYAATHS